MISHGESLAAPLDLSIHGPMLRPRQLFAYKKGNPPTFCMSVRSESLRTALEPVAQCRKAIVRPTAWRHLVDFLSILAKLNTADGELLKFHRIRLQIQSKSLSGPTCGLDG